MKRVLAAILTITVVLLLTACGSKIDGEFTMSSDDTVGAVQHTLVGTDNCEPGGTYTVVCTGGHGALFINEKELFVLAADSYLGEEYSGLVYEDSITIRLKQSDELKARNFNSSKFNLEFTYVDPTEMQETTVQTEIIKATTDNSENAEAAPEVLIALYESTYKQIFSYVKADVSDSVVTVNVGNDGLGAAASSGLVDADTWETFKIQLVDLYNGSVESTKNLMGGRILVLNFVDERDPSSSFLTIADSEVVYDFYAEDTFHEESSPTIPETVPAVYEVTNGMVNALKSAENYLLYLPFSYSGLIGQLEFDQYSHEEAVYAANNCGADWNEQAVKKAKSYLDYMPFSREALIEQLEFDGYTHGQAIYAVDQNGL